MGLTHTLSDSSNSRQNGKARTAKVKLLFASEAVDDLKGRGSEHSAKKTRSIERTQKYDNWFRFGHYRPILQSQTGILHTYMSNKHKHDIISVPRIAMVCLHAQNFRGTGSDCEVWSLRWEWFAQRNALNGDQWKEGHAVIPNHVLTRSVRFPDHRRECYGTLPTKCRSAAFSCANDVNNVYSIQEGPLPSSKRTHIKIIRHQNSYVSFS